MSDVNNTKTFVPPGSDEAIKLGCLCPVMDNNHGRGYSMDEDNNPIYVYNEECPIHRDQIKVIVESQANMESNNV